MNIQQTNGRSVTEALPDIEMAQRDLLNRRDRVGAESREGRLLSNLIQQISHYKKEDDPAVRERLQRFMSLQIAAINQLTADAD